MPRVHTVLRVVFSVLLVAIWELGPTLRLSAAGCTWVALGPEGGMIMALAIDPHTPSTLYAGTHGAVFQCTQAVETPTPTATVSPTRTPTRGPTPTDWDRHRVYLPVVLKGYPSPAIANGGFESGNLRGWQSGRELPARVVTDPVGAR